MTESEDPTEDPIEKRRLEATAVVASKVSQQTAKGEVKRARLWSFFREGLIIILVIVVALLSYRAFTENNRTKGAISHDRERSCSSLHKFALIMPQSDTTSVGIQILAENRNDFYLDNCNSIYGRLPSPDPRMLPYLLPTARR